MKKNTKIIASISDRKCSEDFIRSLYDAGMNAVRINTAHASHEGFDEIIKNTRAVSDSIAIILDTKGPEVRTLPSDSEWLEYKTGDIVTIKSGEAGKTTKECILVSYDNFANDLSVGNHILIDDGELEMVVTGKSGNTLVCEVCNNARLGNRKSVNVPGIRINLPSLTDKDKANILYAIDNNIDFIAHSFVRNARDIEDIKEIGIQRHLIKKCIAARKPVIVATQMLHSMINNPRPTRAEITDIANAVLTCTDAVMLSGETAYGKYPVEAVRMMAKVAIETEQYRTKDDEIKMPWTNEDDICSFLAKQAVKATQRLKVRGIITDSYTGNTARAVASCRGRYPVYAICFNKTTMRQLALSYGVTPYYLEQKDNDREFLKEVLLKLLSNHDIRPSDMVAYLNGSFNDNSGTTFLEINRISTILDKFDCYTPPCY